MDGLLMVDAGLGVTRMRWLGAGPVEASPAAVKAEIAKLEFLPGRPAVPPQDLRRLNKGESLHALKHDLLYAHEGAIRARHLESQTEQA